MKKEYTFLRALTGDIHAPRTIYFPSVYYHVHQLGKKYSDIRPSGHKILATLVESYEAGKDKKGNTYVVNSTDLIHGHYGVKELWLLKKNWKKIHEPFKCWAHGKFLYAWRDVKRHNDCLFVPYMYSTDTVPPEIGWGSLDSLWFSDYMTALCDPTVWF